LSKPLSDRFQTTQLSLIDRLGDLDDRDAWTTFIEIYHPAILASLRRRGLQDSDADDVAQKVLMSVARSLAARPHDPNVAMFRTWLQTIIKNAASNAIQRQPKDRAVGGEAADAFQNLVEPYQNSVWDDLDYRRSLLEKAAQRIQNDYTPDVWTAFWRTAILGESIEDVAASQGKSVGSIYAARSRVIKRLRDEVQKVEEEIDGLA
jgi:RNA polymerase sigma-70 factor (ECF subfamily)